MDTQQRDITVCIFAYNEEKTIQHSIRAFLAQDCTERIQTIYVGANGCSDRTVQRASELLPIDRRLEVIDVAERGKVNMWNVFRQRVRTPYAVFTDGDEEVSPSAVRHLIDALGKNPRLVLAGGRPREVHAPGGLVTWLFRAPEDEPAGITGRLYAASMANLKTAMQRAGFDEMPKRVIHEDLFLTFIVEQAEWVTVPEAVSRHPAPGLRDRFKREVRTCAARVQLDREFPQFRRRVVEEQAYRARTRNRWERLRAVESPARRLALLASYPFKRLALAAINYAARRQGLKHYTTGAYERVWIRTESDKRPVAARLDS